MIGRGKPTETFKLQSHILELQSKFIGVKKNQWCYRYLIQIQFVKIWKIAKFNKDEGIFISVCFGEIFIISNDT